MHRLSHAELQLSVAKQCLSALWADYKGNTSVFSAISFSVPTRGHDCSSDDSPNLALCILYCMCTLPSGVCSAQCSELSAY